MKIYIFCIYDVKYRSLKVSRLNVLNGKWDYNKTYSTCCLFNIHTQHLKEYHDGQQILIFASSIIKFNSLYFEERESEVWIKGTRYESKTFTTVQGGHTYTFTLSGEVLGVYAITTSTVPLGITWIRFNNNSAEIRGNAQDGQAGRSYTITFLIK